jgi:parallel beta-helix repeat protein
VIGNNISKNSQVGVNIIGDNIILQQNEISQNGGNGVEINGAGPINVGNNEISHNGVGGMVVSASRVRVYENLIEYNIETGLEGLISGRVENNRISNNKIGIRLRSSDLTLKSNNISSNMQFGVELRFSTSGSISGNIISKNGWYGVYAYDPVGGTSGDLTLTRNRISSNVKNGIFVDGFSGIHAYHNDVVFNGIQARDSGVNSWDNGYPDGENYLVQYAFPSQDNTALH